MRTSAVRSNKPASKLNPEQKRATLAPAKPLLVLAGAGTGKTRVITTRIAHLIRNGTAPERILAVTFTNKAAREMQQRANEILGKQAETKPEISTFHSLCVRILRRHIQKLGYPERFAIYDRSDQEAAARSTLRELKTPSQSLRPGDLLYFIGRWKNQSLDPDAAEKEADCEREHIAAIAYARYQMNLRAAAAVDFDDLLLLTENLLENFKDVRDQEAGRFDHILIDEYQDTNGSQYKITQLLAASHRSLCVVGDDDQSIYGWRGAEVAHILRFKQDWPEAEVVRLETNYRSRPEILTVANRLIAFNQQRHEKELRPARKGGAVPRILQFQDETAEAKTIIKDIYEILEQTPTQPRHIAILFRTNEQPRAFETALRQAGLPYTLVGGMSFYDRREVRDLLAYLKVFTAPQDEVSLLRILNAPPRGISKPAQTALVQGATLAGKPTYELLADAASIDGVTAKAATAMRGFRDLVENYKKEFSQNKDLVETIRKLINQIGYIDEVKRRYPDAGECESRLAAVEQLISAAGSYQRETRSESLQGFLDTTLLDQRDQSEDEERNAVFLMTLHAAKGLEFPHVYLSGMEEGLLPHHRAVADETGNAIDEERRLCYVGVTRAQDRLTLSLCLSRQKWGKQRDTIPSRFLYEMTGKESHPNAGNARKGKRSGQKKRRTTSRR
jgi:DNA helicase-2/ATP-dependent DNA helicase PcrA